MKLSTIGFVFRETGRNFWRNGWMTLASVSTVAISLFVFAFFLVLTVNVNHLTGVLERQVEVRVFVHSHATPSQEQALLKKAQAWPEVRKITFFTKAQAAASLQKEFPRQKALLSLIKQSNPLFDGYDVYTHNPSQIPTLVGKFHQSAIVRDVVYEGQVAARVGRLAVVLRWLGYGLEVVLGMATLFIIVNTIRLAVFARRREIGVMKLVGATDWFIRWPFILEGLGLGLVGAVLSDVALNYGYAWVERAASLAVPFVPIAPLPTVMASVVLQTVVGGVAIGGLGSLVVIRRFLLV